MVSEGFLLWMTTMSKELLIYTSQDINGLYIPTIQPQDVSDTRASCYTRR